MKKLISILVAFAMMMTLAITAFAEPNVQAENGQSAAAAISKTFEVPEGTTIPDASFDFVFTNVAAESNTGAPSIDVAPIIYSSNDTKAAEDGVVAITKDTGNFLAGVSFPAAGRYVYTVTETNLSNKVADVENWIDSQAEYKVTIDVANKSDNSGLYVKNIAVQKIKDDDGNDISGDGKVNPSDPTDGEANGFNFVNKYTKKAIVDPDGGDPTDPTDPDDPGTNDNVGLYVEKAVVGNLGDKTKDFTFNVTVVKPAFVETTSYTAEVLNADNSVNREETFTPDAGKGVTLKHGQRLVFKDLDYGAKVTVIEAADADYKGALTEAGLESAAANTAVTAYDAELISDTAGRGKTVYNQNKKDDGTTPTGILMNNLPYILLAVVAAGGLIAYLMMKRREANAEA